MPQDRNSKVSSVTFSPEVENAFQLWPRAVAQALQSRRANHSTRFIKSNKLIRRQNDHDNPQYKELISQALDSMLSC